MNQTKHTDWFLQRENRKWHSIVIILSFSHTHDFRVKLNSFSSLAVSLSEQLLLPAPTGGINNLIDCRVEQKVSTDQQTITHPAGIRMAPSISRAQMKTKKHCQSSDWFVFSRSISARRTQKHESDLFSSESMFLSPSLWVSFSVSILSVRLAAVFATIHSLSHLRRVSNEEKNKCQEHRWEFNQETRCAEKKTTDLDSDRWNRFFPTSKEKNTSRAEGKKWSTLEYKQNQRTRVEHFRLGNQSSPFSSSTPTSGEREKDSMSISEENITTRRQERRRDVCRCERPFLLCQTMLPDRFAVHVDVWQSSFIRYSLSLSRWENQTASGEVRSPRLCKSQRPVIEET